MSVNSFNNTGGPLDWFNALPKLTRIYAASLVFTGACISWGIVLPYWLVLDWSKVIFGLQIWRLVTHIFISQPLGWTLLMQIIWTLTYGATLEASTYSMHPEEYLFLFTFATAIFSAASFVMGPILHLGYITVSGSAMVMMLLYVWSKEFPHQDIKLYGIVKIKGFWLPFAFMGLTMLMGGKPGDLMLDALGVIVGHAWYFYTTLLPRGTGRRHLTTPWFVRWAAMKLELGGPAPVQATPPPAQRPPAAGPGGFRAFGGAGRRLNS